MILINALSTGPRRMAVRMVVLAGVAIAAAVLRARDQCEKHEQALWEEAIAPYDQYQEDLDDEPDEEDLEVSSFRLYDEDTNVSLLKKYFPDEEKPVSIEDQIRAAIETGPPNLIKFPEGTRFITGEDIPRKPNHEEEK